LPKDQVSKAMTALTISPEKMAEYLAGARTREAQRRADLAARRERSWSAARSAAAALRRSGGATRVVVFGSLVRGTFSYRSDIDLAVDGVAPSELLKAWTAAEDAAADFAVDLVPIAAARPWVAEVLARDGVEL
jgi:uncharacterized protein